MGIVSHRCVPFSPSSSLIEKVLPYFQRFGKRMAEGVGFEPTEPLQAL